MRTILTKGYKAENYNDYKKPGMFIAFPTCDFKCLTEIGADISICQNAHLAMSDIIQIDPEKVFREEYLTNIFTECLILGGMEPLHTEASMKDVEIVCQDFRAISSDPIIIYTGYYPNERKIWVEKFTSKISNVIIKYGRFQLNSESKYDEILGINLESDNQFAVYYE